MIQAPGSRLPKRTRQSEKNTDIRDCMGVSKLLIPDRDICNVRSMSSFADLVNMGDNCDNNETIPSYTVLMFTLVCTSHPADIDALHVNKQLCADK